MFIWIADYLLFEPQDCLNRGDSLNHRLHGRRGRRGIKRFFLPAPISCERKCRSSSSIFRVLRVLRALRDSDYLRVLCVLCAFRDSDRIIQDSENHAITNHVTNLKSPVSLGALDAGVSFVSRGLPLFKIWLCVFVCDRVICEMTVSKSLL